jgi:hypothetical protein
VKPLTRYAMGTGMNVEPHMAPWPEGPYYRVDKVDAVIRELEAERDAARAEVTALQFRVDQQRILAGFGDTDLRLAREQRDTAYRILRRIAGYRREHFASVYDMADACVYEAVAGVGEQEDSDAD